MAGRLPFDPHHGCAIPPDDGGLAVLRLIRSRKVGPATFHRLLAEHGSASAALDALPEVARMAGISDYAPFSIAEAEAEIAAGQRARAQLLTWDHPAYPPALRDIPEAPPILWIRGRTETLDPPCVAVVGARNASSLGLRMARGLSLGLAEAGVTVIAGLARGIDTVAHEAALGPGTVAVMAGGIDRIYPAENSALAEAICQTGLLVSEQPPGTDPVARHFPARNRIISGLSRAVVVIEAAHRSGSLITARAALDQGREVMAVPGHPMDARAAGCNALLRDGALLIRNSQDVLAALGTEAVPTRPVTAPDAAAPVLPPPSTQPDRPLPMRGRDQGGPVGLEGRILAMLGPSPTEENLLIRDLGIPAATMAPVVLQLELAGRIQRLSGGRIVRLA
ncbi:DNA-processing protein DprA [Paracoccus broussonetiae]|uniref:DNA-processing protein DprA n=1 Tax=Paracoccus broussonetiae TaxID=3075834 RepID=UPI0036F35DCB